MTHLRCDLVLWTKEQLPQNLRQIQKKILHSLKHNCLHSDFNTVQLNCECKELPVCIVSQIICARRSNIILKLKLVCLKCLLVTRILNFLKAFGITFASVTPTNQH